VPAWLKGQLRQTGARLPLPEGWDHQPTVVDGIRAWSEDRDNPPSPGTPRAHQRLVRAEMRALAAALPDSARAAPRRGLLRS